MYALTLFGVQNVQNWKKGYVFGHIDKFWKGHDAQIKNLKRIQKRVESIFIPEKYVFRMCLESPFTRMISSLKYKFPPPWIMTLFIILSVKK